MGGKEVFYNLPPTLRSYALVGHYLNSFSIMEGALNAVIAAAIGLSPVQKAVVCKNISLRDKTKIARTMLSLAFLPDDQRKRYDKAIESIGKHATDRNMVAHDLFDADETGDGVEFFVTKAHGKLEFPETRWSVDDAEEKSDALLNLASTLKECSEKLKNAEIIAALLASPKTVGANDGPPIGGLFQLGATGLADQTAPWFLGSPSSTPSDALGTQQESDE